MTNSQQADALRHVIATHRRNRDSLTAAIDALEAAQQERRPIGDHECKALEELLANRVDVLEAALQFKTVCGPEGLDTTGLRLPAFVESIHAAANRARPELTRELPDYRREYLHWVAGLRGIHDAAAVPAGPLPPAGASEVLDAITEYVNHLDEDQMERLFDGFATSAGKAGSTVNDDTWINDDGGLTRRINITFPEPPDNEEDQADQVEVQELPAGRRWPAAPRTQHWRTRNGHPWRVCVRPQASTECGEVLSAHTKGAAAFVAAQSARTAVAPDECVDIIRWRLSGWELVESLPHMNMGDAAGDGAAEVVRSYERTAFAEDIVGYTFKPIALITTSGTGWAVLLPDPDQPDYFVAPKKSGDGWHPNRVAAIKAAHRLSGTTSDITAG